MSTGLDERWVVGILWLMTAVGSGLGLMVHWMPGALVAVAAMLVGVMGMLGVYLARVPGYPLAGAHR